MTDVYSPMDVMYSPLTLPNGTTLPNRLCKAAMEENMADPGQLPGENLIALYKAWADHDPGLILTGNVMVDPTALTGPGGVVLQRGTLESREARTRFERWAAAGKSGDGQLWMQISHPGRQVYASQVDVDLGSEPVSASETKVAMPGMEKLFTKARALTNPEVKAIVTRFADTALAAQQAGFDGVQIHAAHGYLVAQFLSPLTNLRSDEYGGPLENRALFLLQIIRAVRAATGPKFGVGVKLNSADFQKGGFDIEDARQVVEWLNAETVDMVELSGGSYESGAMMGMSDDERLTSTEKREMYFIDFAKDIRDAATLPIMVTGGVTKRATAAKALNSGGADMIGIARAMAYAPDLPTIWRERSHTVDVFSVAWKNKGLSALAGMAMTKAQMRELSNGRPVKAKLNPIIAIIKDRMNISRLTKRYKAWLASGEHRPNR